MFFFPVRCRFGDKRTTCCGPLILSTSSPPLDARNVPSKLVPPFFLDSSYRVLPHFHHGLSESFTDLGRLSSADKVYRSFSHVLLDIRIAGDITLFLFRSGKKKPFHLLILTSDVIFFTFFFNITRYCVWIINDHSNLTNKIV